jgi:four helix bundle protein
MVYQPRSPLGYRQLLTWKQAGEMLRKVKEFAKRYLSAYEDKRLVNHLVDSARSVQRNIEEGYKRATTKEYVEFLGFSRGSLEELKGDFEELKREIREGIRGDKGKIREDVEELLTLIYGEDCMFGRQIEGLEKKMVKEKTLPRAETVKRIWKQDESADKKFWKLANEKFGIKRDEEGFIIRENKGKDKGEQGGRLGGKGTDK